MNKTPSEAKEFFEGIKGYVTGDEAAEYGIGAPYVDLAIAVENAGAIKVAAENCNELDSGAYTGEVSVPMLKEVGITYCIIGHSERREYEKETNEIVAKKSVNAIKNSLTPLICVGESLETREAKQHLEFIEKQVIESVKDVDLNKAIIAYEPVWAIGTGKVPSLDDIEEINAHIKSVVAKEFGVKDIKVLYGGSVKSSNIDGISKLKSVDGVLVGGASLKGEEFFNIYKNSL